MQKNGSSSNNKKNGGKKNSSTSSGAKSNTTGGGDQNMLANNNLKIIETRDPLVLFQNYSKQCQYMGINVNNAVRHALTIRPRQQQSAAATSSTGGGGSKKKDGGGESSSTAAGNSSHPSCVQLILGPEETKQSSLQGKMSKGKANNKGDKKKNTNSGDQDQQQQDTVTTNSIPNSTTSNTQNGMVRYPSHDEGTSSCTSNNDDKKEVLGDGGCRALVAAILGAEAGQPSTTSTSSSGGGISSNGVVSAVSASGECTVYTAFQEIRIWRSRIGDDGATALARLLSKCDKPNNGVGNIKINLLDLLGNEIGPRGALALGRSLCMGMNDSLISLKLDFNRSLGCDGLVALSKGLKLNNTLKFLSLKFCGIGLRGGAALSDIIAFPRTAIESLDLEGNSLGGKGLEHFCPGLKSNNTLQKLSLADIHILPTDALSMQIFGDAIANHKTLTEVNLLRNILGETGGSELLKHVHGNSKIQSFLVDANLPSDIYLSLCRTVSQPQKKASKKKRKAKKGSKKK